MKLKLFRSLSPPLLLSKKLKYQCKLHWKPVYSKLDSILTEEGILAPNSTSLETTEYALEKLMEYFRTNTEYVF